MTDVPRDPKTGRFTRADDKPVLHRQLTNMDGLPIPQSWEHEPPTQPPEPWTLGTWVTLILAIAAFGFVLGVIVALLS